MTPRIEFLRKRDFGETITDTFVFLKENWKPLLKCILIFCGFFIVAGAVMAILQTSKALDIVNSNAYQEGGASTFIGTSTRFGFFGIEYFISLIIGVLNYTAMPVAVFSYISLYKEKGNIPPDVPEVWAYFKYFYFKILGSGLLLLILQIVGFAFCLVPGIYLSIVFALIYPIMIFENSSFGYAFNRSFSLIKNNWWPTFGVFIVIGIIVYFAIMIIVLPATIINLSNLFLHPGKGFHLSTATTIITNILQHICQVFFVIPFITVSFVYFDLSEKLDNTGLIGRISQLGQLPTDDSQPAEEY